MIWLDVMEQTERPWIILHLLLQPHRINAQGWIKKKSVFKNQVFILIIRTHGHVECCSSDHSHIHITDPYRNTKFDVCCMTDHRISRFHTQKAMATVYVTASAMLGMPSVKHRRTPKTFWVWSVLGRTHGMIHVCVFTPTGPPVKRSNTTTLSSSWSRSPGIAGSTCNIM